MELDLKDYLEIIKKRVWLILAFVIICTLTTGIVSFWFIQPVYEASTKLIVNKSNETQGLNPLNTDTINTNLRLIDTYKEVIKTPRIMDKVVKDYPQFNLTTQQLIDLVKVSSVNNTQVMTLIVQDRSYEKAANIVNAVSKVFQSEIPSIMKVDNVSLLNEAQLTDKPAPVKPNPKLNIAIGFVVSLMVAIGLAFLLEYLDDTVKNEEDVKQILGLPTLSMIVKIKEDDMVNQRTSTSRQAGESKHATVNQ